MVRVVSVSETYRGKTYSQWIQDWCNWFYMANPDAYNNEPWNDIKFLRSFPSPSKIAEIDPTRPVKYEGSAMHRHSTATMVGRDRIIMYDDQAILFPVMLAIWVGSEPDIEYSRMQMWVHSQNFISDDPPLPTNFTIDGAPLDLPKDKQIREYKTDTGMFNLRIPNADYGTSLKDFVIDPASPGLYPAYCQGYFFLVDGFEARPRRYTIFSIARGAPYSGGEYHASFLYEIEVIPGSMRSIPPVSGRFPQSIHDTIRSDLTNKKTSEEIDEITLNEYTGYLDCCQKAQKKFINERQKGEEAAIKLARDELKIGVTEVYERMKDARMVEENKKSEADKDRKEEIKRIRNKIKEGQLNNPEQKTIQDVKSENNTSST